MRPSEIIIDNLRGDGHIVKRFGNYKYGWIVNLKGKPPIFCRTVKELSNLWVSNQP